VKPSVDAVFERLEEYLVHAAASYRFDFVNLYVLVFNVLAIPRFVGSNPVEDNEVLRAVRILARLLSEGK
jgi:hypothetical protein